jgi:hypothetical protein
MTEDRSKVIEAMRERYLVEYRRIYSRDAGVAFFEEI